MQLFIEKVSGGAFQPPIALTEAVVLTVARKFKVKSER